MSISGNGMSYLCLASHDILFIGHFNGIVTVYRESVAINSFLLKSKVLCIAYSRIRKEVYVGNSFGYISVWNSSGKLMDIWKAHENGVNCLEFTDNEVISGGFDGVIKVWRLPIFWVDPEFEKIEDIEAEIQRKTHQVLTSQEKFKIDDLAGWNK